VEVEEDVRRRERLRTLFDQYNNGEPVAGGAARWLGESFRHIQAEVDGFRGTVDARDKRLNELLRAGASKLHIGLTHDCMFHDPREARCLRDGDTDHAKRPRISGCEPTTCCNALVTREHVPYWRQLVVQIQGLLRDRKIPARERERLGLEKDRIETFLGRIEQGTVDEHA
jgi:hypothetical protein